MQLFPAIDLKDGACVRLIKGDMDQSTKFNDDPGDQAAKFEAMGFKNLHVVDLNGAFDGRSTNEEAVKAILSATRSPVQLGGGIRDLVGIERWINAGISRVILGTAAVRDPEFVKSAAKEFPNKIAVGIDAINGMVAVEGWAETTDMAAADLAKKFEDSGVCAIIATDIGRDGMKTGVNVEFTGSLADTVNIPVIASGGVKGVEDINALKVRTGKNAIFGSILGRALYDGDIDPAEAVQIAAE
ncbi:1-(5-phosphoribosyl)-5-[(5-phosphoribosylamino)methylideneamino]imidazole-4-carboxamide isomerase [Hirschia maritima]|uniref:1-(5-phosphoribosyl)-5-[(5- phosphoribosylamino)methylideneamino]imidazole-4- carboxamide isomerase n=1 Tax=Hirschia maritima TaxID=1121961 RepID=UPI000375FF31|nr:1-(5-phosphoribosyl)-5-[(5-phosphoribosylamino)methylideneamino]imidazole-4-carboxamide isomerase [Hirschia maritima]